MERLNGVELLDKFRNGSLKPSEYMERVIFRENLLKNNNYFTVFPADSIRELARKADSAYANGTAGPLEGLPIAIKDNISIAGQQNSAGTEAFWGLEPKKTCSTVAKLMAAGAIPTGRTNMHELAFGVTSNNPFTGPVRNFWNVDHNSGGSSGGSAAVVAADIVPAALGTDTGGSIRIPASAACIYGFRPSTGYWPTDYGIKTSHVRDSCGPMARDMKTIALMDTVMTGNEHEKICLPPSIRIGIPRAYFWQNVNVEMLHGCEAFIQNLKAVGFDVVEAPGPDSALLADAYSKFMIQVYKEIFVTMQEYIDENDLNLTVDEVIAKVKTPQDKSALEKARKNPVTDENYKSSMQSVAEVRAAFEKYAQENDLDCWIFPTVKVPPPLLSSGVNIEHNGAEVNLEDIVSANIDMASIADLPGISMPCGRMLETGVPYGMEIDGPNMSDARLIDIALAIERSGVFPGHIIRVLSRRGSLA